MHTRRRRTVTREALDAMRELSPFGLYLPDGALRRSEGSRGVLRGPWVRVDPGESEGRVVAVTREG